MVDPWEDKSLTMLSREGQGTGLTVEVRMHRLSTSPDRSFEHANVLKKHEPK